MGSRSSGNGILKEVVCMGDRHSGVPESANAFVKHFMSVYQSSSVHSINCVWERDVTFVIRELKSKSHWQHTYLT